MNYTTTYKIIHNGKQVLVDCDMKTGEALCIDVDMLRHSTKYPYALSVYLQSDEGKSIMQTVNSLQALENSIRRNILSGGGRAKEVEKTNVSKSETTTSNQSCPCFLKLK